MTTKSNSAIAAIPLKIPFLTTPLLKDVIYLIIFIPLFWLLGFDQLGWPFLAMLFLAKFILISAKSGRRLFPSIPIIHAVFVFLLFYLCSGFFVQNSVRLITFARNFSMYFSGGVIFLLTVAAVKTEKDLTDVFWALTIFTFITVFIGALVIANILDFEFYAPLYHILPGKIKNLKFARALFLKKPAKILHAPLIDVFRLKVFFAFANPLAGLIDLTIPIQFILWGTTKRRLLKCFLLATLILSIISLSYTLSRGGIIALLVGLGYLGVRKKGFWLKKMFFTILVFLVVLLLNYTLPSVEMFQQRVEKGFARKDPREVIYNATFKSFMELPLLGHGTQLDIPGRPDLPPMASHGTFVGILYKQGILGFMAFAAIIFNLFLMLERLIRQKTDPFLRKVGEFLSMALVALLVQALVIDIDIDSIFLQLVWLFWGLITASYLCYKREGRGTGYARV